MAGSSKHPGGGAHSPQRAKQKGGIGMDTMEERYQLLEDKIRGYLPAQDADRLREVFVYANSHHEGQLRKDGSPFISHPLAVADLVADLELDIESIMAALLHDCIEDTCASYEDVAHKFGKEVADIVDGVTKLSRVQFTSKAEEQMENLRKMLMAMAKDIRVILIKICDRVHNMRTMEHQRESKRREKSLETLEIYAPIAHRLGMQRMKWVMEDLAIKYLDPVAYEEITGELNLQMLTTERFMTDVQDSIQRRLDEYRIRGSAYGRTKHVYSIYRKMFMQNKAMSEIFDLYAFRVIVDDIPSCYNVLGIIHDQFRPILGRFKDYISTPKPNLYQSLHTTVIGNEGIPFEVQIRTWEMHHTAEYGVAAHWKYKQGLSQVPKPGSEQSLSWVRALLENQVDTDAEEYVRTLKVDLFADEVFVFTPQGDVVNLPANATPIDFAYHIHSAIGNGMVAAKVNGRIVNYDYELKSGEIVEITTSKSARGPSREWMKIAKSNAARTKIRQWFKKEKREENIVHGRSAFEAELRHLSLGLSTIVQEELLPKLLKRVRFSSLDDMYAAIGYGGASAQKCANSMREELLRLNRLQAEKEPEPAPAEAARVDSGVATSPGKRSVSGVIVEDMTDCLVKFAKCCTPVPGDPIIGFITRGHGISVHRTDCPNAVAGQARSEERERWLPVRWDDTSQNTYKTAIELTAKDRDNLALDVATILSTAKLRLLSLAAHTLPDGYAKVSLVLEVRSNSDLRSVMTRLNQISDVYEVSRVHA